MDRATKLLATNYWPQTSGHRLLATDYWPQTTGVDPNSISILVDSWTIIICFIKSKPSCMTSDQIV